MERRELLEMKAFLAKGRESKKGHRGAELLRSRSAGLENRSVEELWNTAQSMMLREEYPEARLLLKLVLEKGASQNKQGLCLLCYLFLGRLNLLSGNVPEANQMYREAIERVYGEVFVYKSSYSFNALFLEKIFGRAAEPGSLSPKLETFLMEEYFLNLIEERRIPRREERAFYGLIYLHCAPGAPESRCAVEYECAPPWFREPYISKVAGTESRALGLHVGDSSMQRRELLNRVRDVRNKRASASWKRHDWEYGGA